MTEKGIFPIVDSQAPALDTSITTVVHIDAGAAISDPQLTVLHELQGNYTLTGSVEPDGKVWVRRFQKR